MKIKPLEIAQNIQKENLEKLGKINERKIAMIVREVLAAVQNEIKNPENEILNVAGFGTFKKRTIKTGKDGEEGTLNRIIFKAPKDKSL